MFSHIICTVKVIKLGYLQGRIAADILSICLISWYFTVFVDSFSQKHKYSLPPQQELYDSCISLIAVIRPDYKHRCYGNVIATTYGLYAEFVLKQFKIRKHSKDQIFYS